MDIGQNSFTFFSNHIFINPGSRPHCFFYNALHIAHLVWQFRFDDPFSGYADNLVSGRRMAGLVAQTKNIQPLNTLKKQEAIASCFFDRCDSRLWFNCNATLPVVFFNLYCSWNFYA